MTSRLWRLICVVVVAGLSLREGSAQPSIPGTRSVAQAHAVVNFADLARRQKLAPAAVSAPRQARSHPRRRNETVSPLLSLLSLAPSAPLPIEPFTLATPAIILPSPPPAVDFLAVTDNGTFIPPDTMGAVGPDHVMTTLNTEVRIQDRSGNVISTVDLNAFWASLGSPDAFDPRVTYDAFNGRWIFTAAADDSSPSSAVLVGVSATSDPTGDWFLFRADADPANLISADFDNVGYNQTWIVVTANMYLISNGSFDSVTVFVFDKNDLYTNGSGAFTRINSSADNAFSMAPAVTQDNSLATLYLVEDWDGTVGQLRVSTITGAIGAEQLIIDTARPTTTNRWDFVAANNLAPQLGSTHGIDVGDSRVLGCVYRNGSLWASQGVLLPVGSPKRSAAQWWQFSPGGVVQQLGRIDDPSGTTFYAYPSLAVNASNDVLVGYSRFSASQYPSGNYSIRFAGDPLNTMRADTVLKAGEGPYYAFDSQGLNRWGDYSAAAVDPLDDTTFWTIQEYAAPPSGNPATAGSGVWSAWWGQIDANAASSEVVLTRPADGMRYPSHATVTITASAVNTNVTFAKVDFFASGTKIGEADASPFTITWSNVADGTYDLTARATDTLGTNSLSSPATVVIGDAASPLGTWETKLSGVAKGTAYVTFGDDFSLSGYGMTLGAFGLFTVGGSWTFNDHHQPVGFYAELLNGNPLLSGTFLAKVKSGKKLQAAVTPAGSKKALKLNGVPAALSPDVTGQWTAIVTTSGNKTSETYTFARSATLANVFDLAGQGAADTLTGTLLVTSRGALNASMTNTVLRSLAGKTTRAITLTLKGVDSLGHKLAIKATKQ